MAGSTDPEFPSDLIFSLHLLRESFMTWHRLQQNQIATRELWSDYMKHPTHFPERFQLLHAGTRCPHSHPLAQGQHATVFQRGSWAYKRIKLHVKQSWRSLYLRCYVHELACLHQLRHPHIQQAQQSQLVMQMGHIIQCIHQLPLIRSTLASYCQRSAYSDTERLRLHLYQIGEALSYMHQRGLVHGDVTPTNIGITMDQQACLLDFTLSKPEAWCLQNPRGSWGWRSPEAEAGLRYTRASDVFSFGLICLAVLYSTREQESALHQVHPEYHEWVRSILAVIQDMPPVPPDLSIATPTVLWNTEQFPLFTAVELQTFEHLVRSTLQQDPVKRATMKDVLTHIWWRGCHPTTPACTLPPPKDNITTACEFSVVSHLPNQVTSSLPKPIELIPTHHDILVSQWVKAAYHTCMGTMSNDHALLHHITYVCIQIIQSLERKHVTFTPHEVIHMVCTVACFLWCDYEPETESHMKEVEANLYHVLMLSNFQILPPCDPYATPVDTR
jgi:serine/threonine protein kinase